LYISASGDAGTLEIGADGLPTSLSDAAGNKVTFANFTLTTADVTVFDQAGNKLAGPTTIPVDAAILAKLRAASASLSQPSAQGVFRATSALLGLSTQEWLKIEVNVVGLGLGLAGCGAIVVAGTLPAGPLGVMAGAACVSALIDAAQQMQGTDSSPGMEYATIAADAGSCIIALQLFECLGLIVDELGLALDADLTAPSVPTGLAISVVDQTKAAFYWTGSTDDVAVAGYRIYRNGSQVAQVPITYYRDQTVVAGTNYCYTVLAYDAAGHSSGLSEALCVTIPPVPAPIPPTTNPVAYLVGTSSLLRVDVSTGSVVTVATGLTWPKSVALTADGTAAYVNDGGGATTGTTIKRIDLGTGGVTTFPLPNLFAATGIAMAQDGMLYVLACGSTGCPSTDSLYAVNPSTGATQLVASSLGNPYDIAIEAGGVTALVTTKLGSNAQLVRVNLSTGTVTPLAALYPLSTSLPSGLGGLSIKPGGTAALVTILTGLKQVDLTTGAVTVIPYQTAACSVAWGIAALPDGANALMGCGMSSPNLVAVNLTTGALTSVAGQLPFSAGITGIVLK
jgi:hypothetical protein